MAHTHCTGPGTGTGSAVHIAVQGMVYGIGETYCPVPDPTGSVWNPSVPVPVSV